MTLPWHDTSASPQRRQAPFHRGFLHNRSIGFGIPIDPDVADFMGAFAEDALELADVIEDGLLTINGQGEVSHESR